MTTINQHQEELENQEVQFNDHKQCRTGSGWTTELTDPLSL